MDSELLAALISVPAAIAVIATVSLFLRHMANENDVNRTLWANHLSKITEVQLNISVTLQKVVDKLEEVVTGQDRAASEADRVADRLENSKRRQ
jgi:hypothetical protein